jgi:hypothetical protein
VAQPDQRPPTEVGDQEADLASADRSASAEASTSTTATGGAASTAASNEFKFKGDCPRSPTSP